MRHWLWFLFLLCCCRPALAADARFDLVGPKIDVRVTRNVDGTARTLPIASVPNLQEGDKLWIHPDLPPTQSVKYLLICAFLRGTTNPPPDGWFYRIETWKKEVRDEGAFISVPAEAQQVVLFMAPETGGDFATLKSAVRGRPGIFVRASQDLNEAGFEQARIERYLADIRRVSPSDPSELQRRSDLLARTLALKPNADCFKRPVDVQFTCLTQSGTQTLLDDGHGGDVASTLANNGPTSDLIQATSYTGIAGAGLYSAYVGAVVDLVRLMSSLHTAQYQYIPAVAFPQADSLNLRLNTPPSFHNPKSVLVIGLPAIQAAQQPPLRPANANEVACLLKPKVVLPIEGAPLVFSTDFATGIVLHLNTPPGAPRQADIPLLADAFEGGLVLQHGPEHHVPLQDARVAVTSKAVTPGQAVASTQKAAPLAQTQPVTLTGTIEGRWGFDTFTGPTVPLQQLPGGNWHVVHADGGSGDIIVGKTAQLLLDSTGSACVHTVVAESTGGQNAVALSFRRDPNPDHRDQLAVSLPDGRRISPGSLRLQIQQYGEPQPDAVATQTFADPPHLESVALSAADKTMILTGSNLVSIEKITLGDLVFRPVSPSGAEAAETPTQEGAAMPMRFALSAEAPQPPTHAGDKLAAQVILNDGRRLPLSLTVLPARPAVSLISRAFDPLPGSLISLGSADDLPLAAHLTFTLKSRNEFPRNGQIEVETLDGTLRTVLTLAPSGGLVLQDPHTVVASLDPLRSFGPSAFGALHLRAVFPLAGGRGKRTEGEPAVDTSQPHEGRSASGQDSASNALPTTPEEMRQSDWTPLGTLVRLPTLTRLQCTGDAATACNLAGLNLFLIQAVSADPAFSSASPVPDGFTGNSLPVPHPSGSSGTLFVRLRDDPEAINPANLPTSSTTTQASTTHSRATSTHN